MTRHQLIRARDRLLWRAVAEGKRGQWDRYRATLEAYTNLCVVYALPHPFIA